MPRDFWRKSKVVVAGGGSWGTVLAQLVAQNAGDVRLWMRDESRVRAVNSTRSNPDYAPGIQLNPKIHAFHDVERAFRQDAEQGVDAVIWALPSGVSRAEARRLAPLFTGRELVIHATKGIEEGTLKRMSEVLLEELPCPRVGVLSGPNLATEVAAGEPAATVVASTFIEVVEAGEALFSTPRFRVYPGSDVIGVEWAGALKNILAIAAGALEALKFGSNTRAMLITRGLAEMVRFGAAMGAEPATFLGLAGVGDLLATCSSPLSRNFRVGLRLAGGEPLAKVLAELGSTAEGARTARIVWEHAEARGIVMPITEAVCRLMKGDVPVQEILESLLRSPAMPDRAI